MLCHRPVCVTKKGDIVGWKFRVDDDDKPGFKDNLKAKDEKSWVVLGNGCKPNGLRLAPDPLEDDGHLMMTDASGKEFRFNGVGVFNTIGHGYDDMTSVLGFDPDKSNMDNFWFDEKAVLDS